MNPVEPNTTGYNRVRSFVWRVISKEAGGNTAWLIRCQHDPKLRAVLVNDLLTKIKVARSSGRDLSARRRWAEKALDETLLKLVKQITTAEMDENTP